MRVILGIGNPGLDYAGTRHNCGFFVVDALQPLVGDGWTKQKKWSALIAKGRLAEQDVLLVKPQTYVNRSGATAQALCAFYKIAPAELLVVVDDIHLPLGHLRLRAQGSSGGHNGLKDIEARLGRAYPRLRLGIGGPTHDQIDHVLGRFDTDEQPIARDMISKAGEACLAWLREGPEAAMRFNGPVHPPAPQPRAATDEDPPAEDQET